MPVAGAQEEPLPDLTVETTGPATLAVNEYVHYQVVLTNAGPGDATVPPNTVLFRDEISFYGRWGSVGFSNGGCAVSTSLLGYLHGRTLVPYTWEKITRDYYSVLPSGGTCTYSPSASLQDPGRIKNCAIADPNNAVRERDETNNTSCVTTVVEADKGGAAS